MKLIYLEEFGRAFIPEKIRPKFREYVLKAGIPEVPYRLFGGLFYVSLVITYFIYFYQVYPALQSASISTLTFLFATFIVWFLIQLGIVAFFMLIVYAYLDLQIFNRTKQIEEVLDEFLNYVSESLKGGMSLDKALWSAVRPEFDVLSREIQIASKKVSTGVDVEDALREFITKYDSPMTRRSFELIIEGIKGGGELAEIINKVVDNIRETKLLKKEIVAANTTYVMFISIIVIVIAPALFALSRQMLVILSGFSAKVGSTLSKTTLGLPLNFQQLAIDMDDFVLFSQIAVSIVAVCSSMIISQINRGNIKSGLKYIPLFLAASLITYSIISNFLASVFSSFFAA
ncbi:MAG: type II secretion system F family protein [Candidatus Woesearchaeota archaeon]